MGTARRISPLNFPGNRSFFKGILFTAENAESAEYRIVKSSNNAGLVKSQKMGFPVIPAKAGIPEFKLLKILRAPVSTGVTTVLT
jgi:hypothetical protein